MTLSAVWTPSNDAAVGTHCRKNDHLVGGTEFNELVGKKKSGERLVPETAGHLGIHAMGDDDVGARVIPVDQGMEVRAKRLYSRSTGVIQHRHKWINHMIHLANEARYHHIIWRVSTGVFRLPR